MKIVQVNCVYNKGSTGKIVYDIHLGLQAEDIKSVVLYGRGDTTDDAGVYKTCGEIYAKLNNLRSRFTGVMYGGCTASTRKLIGMIKKENPDIVHLHCINGFFVNIYWLIDWLKVNRIKTVLTLHAEFMYTANCGYALDCDKWLTGCGNCPRRRAETGSLFFDNTARSYTRMKQAFSGFDDILTVVSVSPWLMQRAERSPILGDKRHLTVLNGIDTGVFNRFDGEQLRRSLAPGGQRIVFHATARFDDTPGHLKGGRYVIDLARRLKDENVVFVVAGAHSLSGDVPENMILLGEVRNQRRLAEYYSCADVTLLTSKKETFSMICAESLCCGTPVVGFEAGAPEQIAVKEFSRFVPQGDTVALQDALKAYLSSTDTDKEAISRTACDVYSRRRMVDSYIEIYRGMLCD